MYKEKIADLVSRLQSKGEQESVPLVTEMLKICGAYIQRVNVLEALLISRPSEDPEKYRQMVTELDKQRSDTHNSLISSVTVLNRLCKTADMQPIFEGDTKNRAEVAEFALKVVNEFFNDRRK